MTAKKQSLTDILELYVLDRTPSEETIKLLTKVIRPFSKIRNTLKTATPIHR